MQMVMGKLNTQQKGQLAQLKVEQRALEKGCMVSRPTTDARYDLIVDVGGKLQRVQIKYCSAKVSTSSGSFMVDLRRWAGDKRTVTRNYTKQEIDALMIYLPATDKVYRLPASLVHEKSSITLRVAPSSNGQHKGIRMASRYEW